MADHSGGRGGAPRGAFRTQRGAGRRRSQRRGGAAPAAPPQPPTTASNRGGGAGRGRGGKKRGGGKGKGKGNGNGTPAVPVVPDYTPTTAAPLPPALVDIGLNLTSRKFHHDRDEVMARAVSVGVRTVVLTGCEMRGNLDASKYAVQAADRARAARARGDTSPQALVFSTAGFHPHNAKQLRIPTDIDKLRELCAQPHVVAVGECGLDYNRDFSPRDVQVAAFKAQIQLAIELGMPMFVHERDAHDDLMACFDSFDAATLPDVVVHCFTGSEPALRAYIDRGFYIGLTGTLCMSQRGRELRRIASTIPLDRLMIETDAPFMSPVKSVRRCEPMHMVNVCEGVAKAYGLPYAQIAAATTANAARFFRFSDAFKAMKAGTAGGKATAATPPPPHVPPRSASAAGAGGGAGAGSGVSGDTTAVGAPAPSKPGVSAKTAPGSNRGSGSGGDSSSYVDTHCHLDTVLQRLKLQSLATLRKRCPAGLEGVVAIFCDPAAFSPSFGVWRSMLDEPGVYGAFGIHPHSAKFYTPALAAQIRECLKHPSAVAYGEIGLDYHYNHSPRDVQRSVFQTQLVEAVELGKPIVIHVRKAEADALAIMKDVVPPTHVLHLHCYTGNATHAAAFRAAFPNLYFGFTGFITFAGAAATRDALACGAVPLSRVLLETDGPHMMPEATPSSGRATGPQRKGKRGGVCHPGHIPAVAEGVAAAMGGGSTAAQVLSAARVNTRTVYGV